MYLFLDRCINLYTTFPDFPYQKKDKRDTFKFCPWNFVFKVVVYILNIKEDLKLLLFSLLFQKTFHMNPAVKSYNLSPKKRSNPKPFLAHLSRRLIGELIVYEGIHRSSVNIFKRHLL